jgi:hypothetical protein
MFPSTYFVPSYFASRYFLRYGALPTVIGVPTVCPPVTPNWTLLNITSDLTSVFTEWKPPDVVDDNLES